MIGWLFRFLGVLFYVLDSPLVRLIEPVWILYAIVIQMAIQRALGRFSPLVWTLSRLDESDSDVVKLDNRLICALLFCEWAVANFYWLDARYEAALVAYVGPVLFFTVRVLFTALFCTYLYDNLEEARLARESKNQ